MFKRVPFTPGDLTDHQQGTDDIFIGDLITNILIGDAGGSMFDFSKGGNDTFTESAGSNYTFFGDAAGGRSLFLRRFILITGAYVGLSNLCPVHV